MYHPTLRMVDFRKLFTVKSGRDKENGVPAFEKLSHKHKYRYVVPDRLMQLILASSKAHEAINPVFKRWEEMDANIKSLSADKTLVSKLKQEFTAFLASIGVGSNLIGALNEWKMIHLPTESKMTFLEFLLQPEYHCHFLAILGEERIFELNKEIDLRGYLHEVGVLCRLLKAHRVGSQDPGSDVDILCHVEHMGQELDPDDQKQLVTNFGHEHDITLFTTTKDGQKVETSSKGEPWIVQFLCSCNGIMPPLTPEQMHELLQVRIKGFWALFCRFDLLPFLIRLGKSEEDAKAILARAQEGTLVAEDMDALITAFRNGRVTIPTEQRILYKWTSAINSLLKQYLHIMALVNGLCTAEKATLIAKSGITGNALSFLEYNLYHGKQGSLKQEGVTDLLHQMLNDASLFTSALTLGQGPMCMARLAAYAQRLAQSKSVSGEQDREQPYVPLTGDVLQLLLTEQPDHPVVKWVIAQIRSVAIKFKDKEPLSPFETSFVKLIKSVTSETKDEDLVAQLKTWTSKELKKVIPTTDDIPKSMPSISKEEVDRLTGMLMSVNNRDAFVKCYGDKVSKDRDMCVVIFLRPENASTYIVKTSTGLFVPRELSSSITRGGDVSALMLTEKDGKLFPVEIRNFYLDKDRAKVYTTEVRGKVVHINGTPVPQTVVLDYELVPAKLPQLLERYAILYFTGIMDEEFRKRLSHEPLNYTPEINQGKWRDLVHYIIRWVTDTLTELSVLLHMLRTINAPQSLIARIEALKAFRDRLFQTMPQTDAIPQEIMQEWVSMLQEVFALGLHTPDVLAFIQRNGDIKGLTGEQTEKIQQYVKTMYMDRLSFFKAIVFRLCQITYGLFVCIPENQRMIYVKAELAEKVMQVLHEKGMSISIDTLMALLHRNYSLPSDIRLASSLHVDFERFVLEALAVLFPCFTGQDLCPRAMSEPVSWDIHAPVPESVQEPLPAPIPESVQEPAPNDQKELTLNDIMLFVQTAKDRSPNKDTRWKTTIAIFAKRYDEKQVDRALVEMLLSIAQCDNILKAIAIIAKQICGTSQPQRIEALIVLTLVNYFGHGQESFVNYFGKVQESFVNSVVVKKGAYDPREDIKALRERFNDLNKSSQAPAPAPVLALAPVHASLYDMYRKEVHAGIKKCMRGLGIIAVFDDSNSEKVIVVVQNDDVFHISPLPEGTLCIMSYTHPALSKELLSSMTHRLTTPNFQILGTIIPETTIVPFAMTKKQLTYNELHIEVVSFLAAQGIHFLSILRFGSSLQHAEEKRPMERDVDYRVLITEGERKGFEFTASDGTICDLSFTTMDNAKTQHEVLIAMLLGSSWMDASGNKVEPFGVPSTLKESLQLLLPLVGRSIHYNGLKGKDDPVKTFQSIQLMVIMMLMVVNHNQYPRYDPLVFFPEGFNKDAFVQFLKTSTVNCVMIVNLFTKAQYMVSKDGLKAQESNYASTLEAFPAPLKQLMITFKTVTTTSFPNPSDKKGVSGVRLLLEWISK